MQSKMFVSCMFTNFLPPNENENFYGISALKRVITAAVARNVVQDSTSAAIQ
jgi:hypothetical protein